MGNKNPPMRLSPALRDELDREIGSRMVQGLPKPTYGELLTEAWECRKKWLQRAISTDSPAPLSKAGIVSAIEPIPNLKTPEGLVPVTAEEWAWVSRVLKVVRGGCGQALNLIDASVLLTELTAGSLRDKPTNRLPESESDNLDRKVEQADRTKDKIGKDIAGAERVSEKIETPPEDLRPGGKGHKQRPPSGGRNRKSA